MFANLSSGAKIALQLAFVVVLFVIVIVIITSLGVTTPSSGNRIVHLRVDASGGFAIITMQAGPKYSISKSTTVTVPWVKTLDVPAGTQVYLTASNPTQTGKLSCTITLDKVSWKSATTNAPKDGVACAGIVP
jgi:predicted RecA/RadA family phage recombinase